MVKLYTVLPVQGTKPVAGSPPHPLAFAGTIFLCPSAPLWRPTDTSLLDWFISSDSFYISCQ
uniref:Uncharacterized protein n=1 Tax=Arundo donax TaxID=35708 RepID=A0A0A9GD67_ARUDO